MDSASCGKAFFRAALAAAAVTAAVLAPTAPADAAAADFELQVTWKTLSLSDRMSCDPTGPPQRGGGRFSPSLSYSYECGGWERVNASMSVEGGSPVTPRVRNLGTWDRRARSWDREESWSSDEFPDHPAFLGTGNDYDLAQRPLCTTDTYKRCLTDYLKDNNTVTVRGAFGARIRFAAHLQTTDRYDDERRHTGTGECKVEDFTTWDQAQVDRYTAGRPREITLLGSYDGRNVCAVRYELVAKRLR
ncbi:hypothetical protein Ppa06_66990 [Planomonospora parontospora subsp. parontospora]|uniref:Secreted protein n=2 Tax=Planomonospora parontospora TaxID=58119 RepID=A0AA37BNF8_9ACTN|nr:hypothetical protein [Planomonospora parontospora]GGK98762.1 hypothetical protein GCM10010126_67670 [Planomonospora parontospora]GII12901.1 hypothetical protein Ppa06_66990 [Planomonospora parontospora subsp. parontospora]